MVTSTITNVPKVAVCWVWMIWTDLVLQRQILLKHPNTQLNVNPSRASRVFLHGISQTRQLTYKNTTISPNWQTWFSPYGEIEVGRTWGQTSKQTRLQTGQTFREIQKNKRKGKGKAVPLQACTGPESSRKLRFPDFVTTAQDGGKVVSLRHRAPLPPGNTPGIHFC